MVEVGSKASLEIPGGRFTSGLVVVSTYASLSGVLGLKRFIIAESDRPCSRITRTIIGICCVNQFYSRRPIVFRLSRILAGYSCPQRAYSSRALRRQQERRCPSRRFVLRDVHPSPHLQNEQDRLDEQALVWSAFFMVAQAIKLCLEAPFIYSRLALTC